MLKKNLSVITVLILSFVLWCFWWALFSGHQSFNINYIYFVIVFTLLAFGAGVFFNNQAMSRKSGLLSGMLVSSFILSLILLVIFFIAEGGRVSNFEARIVIGAFWVSAWSNQIGLLIWPRPAHH